MKYLVSIVLLFVYLNVFSQSESTRNWVDSELKHTDANGNSVKFINSFPRGGGVVYKNGVKYSYVVFWTRMFNLSTTPIEFKVNFPEVTYFNSPEFYTQIVLPKEIMSMDKVQSLDYGLTNLQSLLNDKSKQLSFIQKKINPNEEYIFYTAFFIHGERWGLVRAKFELKNHDLFYKISMGSDTTIIPCGSLYFKK